MWPLFRRWPATQFQPVLSESCFIPAPRIHTCGISSSSNRHRASGCRRSRRTVTGTRGMARALPEPGTQLAAVRECGRVLWVQGVFESLGADKLGSCKPKLWWSLQKHYCHVELVSSMKPLLGRVTARLAHSQGVLRNVKFQVDHGTDDPVRGLGAWRVCFQRSGMQNELPEITLTAYSSLVIRKVTINVKPSVRYWSVSEVCTL